MKRLFGGCEDENEGVSDDDSEQQRKLSTVSNANGDPSIEVENDTLSSTPKVPGKLGEFLKLPPPPSQVSELKALPRGRVLTSEENVRALEENEQRKNEEAELRNSGVWIEKERDG